MRPLTTRTCSQRMKGAPEQGVRGGQETGGTYGVALNEKHLEELISEHAPPPPARAADAAASLVRPGVSGKSATIHIVIIFISCFGCGACAPLPTRAANAAASLCPPKVCMGQHQGRLVGGSQGLMRRAAATSGSPMGCLAHVVGVHACWGFSVF